MGVDVERMLDALRNPACYPHPVQRVETLETHISWVILTGSYAYKIKKPVNLGFLDFTTLAARRHYCEEELRLNRRLAPQLYLAVVTITGTPQQPVIGGDGPVLEYAVQMREFAQSSLLDSALARGAVGAPITETLARKIAAFHIGLPPALAIADDAATASLAPALDNFRQMLPLLEAPQDIETLLRLRDWTQREYQVHAPRFAQRQAAGCVRECHGDLHLGNIVMIDGEATPFDCVEFNPALRWMDTISEVAFTAMDLEAHGRRDLASVFLNAYLEPSGDYDGVAVLPFYLAYRAAVRAKTSLIRSSQHGAAHEQIKRARQAYQRYLALAASYTASRRGAIIITHGLSGTGKTTLTQTAVAALGAVRVRSDIERKRLHGLAASARSGAATGAGIYAADATARTYEQLARHARSIAVAGYPVIVDAAFLKREQRAAFGALARELDVPFVIASFSAPPERLRVRVAERAAQGGDASEATLAVLESQIATHEPLTADELDYAVTVDACRDAAASARALNDELAQRLRQ
ncbi:MAG: AAA family ATPase [Betaproteobacteria bacterium]|nr:AAA family ATPase [Betaproteobacteria bacterium]